VSAAGRGAAVGNERAGAAVAGCGLAIGACAVGAGADAALVVVSCDAGGAVRGLPPKPRNRIGVTTMTSALSRSARKVRLSMQASGSRRAATERDHTRPAGMGGTVQCDEPPTRIRAPRRTC